MENLEFKIQKLQNKIDLQHKIYRFVLVSTIIFVSGLILYVIANLAGVVI